MAKQIGQGYQPEDLKARQDYIKKQKLQDGSKKEFKPNEKGEAIISGLNSLKGKPLKELITIRDQFQNKYPESKVIDTLNSLIAAKAGEKGINMDLSGYNKEDLFRLIDLFKDQGIDKKLRSNTGYQKASAGARIAGLRNKIKTSKNTFNGYKGMPEEVAKPNKPSFVKSDNNLVYA